MGLRISTFAMAIGFCLVGCDGNNSTGTAGDTDQAGDSAVSTGDEVGGDDGTVNGDTYEPGDSGGPAGDEAPQFTSCTLAGDECDPGDRCVPFGAGESLICAPVGDVAIGDPCGANGSDDCVAGAVCLPFPGDEETCVALCTPGWTAIPCTEPEECIPFYGAAGSNAGICLGDDCTPPAVGCEANERCSVIADRTFACLGAGTVPLGGDCSDEDCMAGAICRGIDGEYLCRAFCTNTSECSEEDDHCVWPWQEFTTLGYCRPGCDPILQSDCDSGDACYFMDPEYGSTVCFSEGSHANGEDCSDMLLCESGHDCILVPDSDPWEYYCRPYCDDEHTCATGTCMSTEAMAAMKVCMP